MSALESIETQILALPEQQDEGEISEAFAASIERGKADMEEGRTHRREIYR